MALSRVRLLLGDDLERGRGFDEGELTLERLDGTEVTERWPSVLAGTSHKSPSGNDQGQDTND